jgi:hypothetical protein
MMIMGMATTIAITTITEPQPAAAALDSQAFPARASSAVNRPGGKVRPAPALIEPALARSPPKMR